MQTRSQSRQAAAAHAAGRSNIKRGPKSAQLPIKRRKESLPAKTIMPRPAKLLQPTPQQSMQISALPTFIIRPEIPAPSDLQDINDVSNAYKACYMHDLRQGLLLGTDKNLPVRTALRESYLLINKILTEPDGDEDLMQTLQFWELFDSLTLRLGKNFERQLGAFELDPEIIRAIDDGEFDEDSRARRQGMREVAKRNSLGFLPAAPADAHKKDKKSDQLAGKKDQSAKSVRAPKKVVAEGADSRKASRQTKADPRTKSKPSHISVAKNLKDWRPGQASESGRGNIVSSTNPRIYRFGGKTRLNPFFATMPAPEVWHSRMPPYLPFGETPILAKIKSDQINRDLNRGKNKANKVNEAFTSSSAKGPSPPSPTPPPKQQQRGFWGMLSGYILGGSGSKGNQASKLTRPGPRDLPKPSEADFKAVSDACPVQPVLGKRQRVFSSSSTKSAASSPIKRSRT